MANWIKQPCLELLKKINDVPLDDNRESRQLTILMAGIADMNKEMMRRAAESARAQLGDLGKLRDEAKVSGSGGSEAAADGQNPKQMVAEDQQSLKDALDDTPDLDDFDAFDEELDMIEQTLIRSISD